MGAKFKPRPLTGKQPPNVAFIQFAAVKELHEQVVSSVVPPIITTLADPAAETVWANRSIQAQASNAYPPILIAFNTRFILNLLFPELTLSCYTQLPLTISPSIRLCHLYYRTIIDTTPSSPRWAGSTSASTRRAPRRIR
jgi:hypothetical protein